MNDMLELNVVVVGVKFLVWMMSCLELLLWLVLMILILLLSVSGVIVLRS